MCDQAPGARTCKREGGPPVQLARCLRLREPDVGGQRRAASGAISELDGGVLACVHVRQIGVVGKALDVERVTTEQGEPRRAILGCKTRGEASDEIRLAIGWRGKQVAVVDLGHVEQRPHLKPSLWILWILLMLFLRVRGRKRTQRQDQRQREARDPHRGPGYPGDDAGRAREGGRATAATGSPTGATTMQSTSTATLRRSRLTDTTSKPL